MKCFTDDDLKRLKNYYEDPKRGDTPLKWKALLARLETAEKVCSMVDTVGALDHYEVVLKAWAAWREAAGK